MITQAHLRSCHVTYDNTSLPQFLPCHLSSHKPISDPAMSHMITQAHLSSCHVTNVNTTTSVPITFLMITQAHLIMLLVITQEQPSSHHVAYNTSPHQCPSVAHGNTNPHTSFLCSLLQKFPVIYGVTSGHSSHSNHAICVFVQYTH